ncbi:MAG TPA: ABC transporter permease [Verrucomicrobiae bacterium]|nr:ABC transporter permease [Verrucomicrobiae bacterium]
MSTFGQDLRFALRTLAKKPGFLAVVIATLALGIGANTAIFSVVRAVLLKPLPFRDADRLVHIWETNVEHDRYRWGDPRGFIIVRPATFFDWKSQSRSFESITAFASFTAIIGGGERAESVYGHDVDESFFDTLGVRPLLGRTFRADDYQSAGRAVILSYTLWQTHFGGDRAILGKSITLDSVPCQVVGVMPEGFYQVRWGTPLLWRPLSMEPAVKQSRVLWKLFTFARLKPGVTFDQAQQEMDVIAGRLKDAYHSEFSAVLTPVTGYLFSEYERLFYILLGSVGLVLLIACVNVANLLLARAAERDREFSLRVALGASRSRLMRLVLTESLVLSGAGGLFGIGLAVVSIRPIIALLPASRSVPRIADTTLDWPVLMFTLGAALLSGVLFGIVPALRASRPNLNESLKDGGRAGSAGVAARRFGDLLIVAEVAVSLVLLVEAGLLIQSFIGLMRSNPGLNTERVIALLVDVPAHRYGKYEIGGANPSRARLFTEIERRLRNLPGAASAAVTALLPLRHGPNPWGMHIEGMPEPPVAFDKGGLWGHGRVSIQRVSPGYFETFGIPLVRGRYFDARDAAGAPMVALVNETNARRYFGGQDPVGRTIVLDMTSYHPRVQIVGVVADSRLNAPDQEVYPQVFWPIAQWPSSGGWVAVRTKADPAGFANSIQQTLREIDSDLAISQVATMHDVLGDSVWRQRLTAVLLGVFAGLATLLAAAGIYGVFSYAVSRRIKELGVRMALGASRARILRLVLGTGLRLALIGIGIGVVAALASGHLISSWLYGIQSYDGATIAGVSLVLLAAAALACYVPALRATRVDPLAALREQ